MESFLNDPTLRPPPAFQARRSLRGLAAACRQQAGGGGVPCSLVCDANGFVFYMLRLFGTPPANEEYPNPELFGVDFELLRARTEAFIAALRLCGVEPEFVWDGPLKDAAKDATGAQRRLDRAREALEVVNFCETKKLAPGAKLRVSLGVFAWPAVSEALKAARVAQSTASGEADNCMAAMVAARRARGEACLGVLAQDSDFCVYESCVYLPLNSVEVGAALWRAAEAARGAPAAASAELPADADATVVVVEPADVAAALGLPVARLPELAFLCGNDYSKPLWRNPARGGGGGGAVLQLEREPYAAFAGDSNPRAVAAWMLRELVASGDAPLEAHAEAARALKSCAPLAGALAFTRRVYAHGVEELADALTRAGATSAPWPAPERPPGAPLPPLAARLLGDAAAGVPPCAWSRVIAAGRELGLLPSRASLLEGRAADFSAELEPPPLISGGLPAAHTFKLPFEATVNALLCGVGCVEAAPCAPGKRF
jgi:hypothetical protein